MEGFGYTSANTIAAYVIDGVSDKGAEAKLYTYNGKCTCRILGIDGSVYKKWGVRLKILLTEAYS